MMAYKKLISPEFRISTSRYEITSGMEVEVFSSRSARADWGKVDLTSQYQGLVTYEDMEEARIELGYDDDFDTLLDGYCRKNGNDYWKEIIIRDAMIKLERVTIKNTFIDYTPQDIIQWILVQAGITDYKLTDENFGKRDVTVIEKQNGIKAISHINMIWGIEKDFFFQNNVFYWGCKPEQKYIYVLDESENILSMNKSGEFYEIETLGVPWIHHSQEVEVVHSKYSGIVTVEKTIVRSSSDGYTRMFICFKGG